MKCSKQLYVIATTMLIVFLVAGDICNHADAQQKNVRKAVVAGQFYPGSEDELREHVQMYLDQAEKVELTGELHALVVPHAGYIYSAPIAGYAYQQIEKKFKRVFIFASNHNPRADVDGLSVPDYTHYETPLGQVRVSPLVQELLQENRISSVQAAHQTHIIEVQLPFLQMILDDFEIIPVITGYMDFGDVKRFGELFNRYVDDETLFIVSTDLSHYHPYNEAISLDTFCVTALEQLDTRGVIDAELCGQGAALILLEIAQKQGWQGKILNYRNSGDTAGDKSQVVGYAAIAYYASKDKPVSTTTSALPDIQPTALNEEEQNVLLDLARATLDLYVKEHKIFEPDEARFHSYPKLQEPRGTFVTLKKHGELRGCIGNLIGKQPLYLSVRDNAINAAVHDSRFLPVMQEELPDITLSISVLDVPQLLHVETPEDYPKKLTHTDGVIIVSGLYQSTYLPQVWEQLPEPVEFLSHLCVKGGTSPDCWKKANTKLYTYRAQEFGQE